jgi:hypothetical protein
LTFAGIKGGLSIVMLTMIRPPSNPWKCSRQSLSA